MKRLLVALAATVCFVLFSAQQSPVAAHGACKHTTVWIAGAASADVPTTNYSIRKSVLVRNALTGGTVWLSTQGSGTSSADAGIVLFAGDAYSDNLGPAAQMSAFCVSAGSCQVALMECP